MGASIMAPTLLRSFLLLNVVGLVLASSVTPVQKVIQLLEDMKATAQNEKNDEAVAFSKFDQFCTNKQRTTKDEIKAGEEKKELLTTEIQKLEADIRDLAKELDELQRTVASAETDIESKKKQREEEHASYLEEHEDLAESLDAIERAITVLKKQDVDRKQAAAALIQLSSEPKLPEHTRRSIQAFIELAGGDEEDPLSTAGQGVPEANAYESQSGGIVDLLMKLKDDFRKQKTECEKEEMNSKHASDMVIQDLTDTIENAKAEIASKSIDLQNKKERAAEATKELGVVTADLAEDKKFLSDLEAECSEKAHSFKEKQQLRTEEIAAIEKAIEILSSAAVSGNADKHLPGVLTQTGTSLVQLQGPGRQTEQVVRTQLLEFLNSEGQRLRSKQLELLAGMAAKDPFAKVKKMIEELIKKLIAEATAEAEQKGFCDKELGTNKITRDKLNSEIDELTAAIDEGNALITQLTADIAKLTGEVADLDAAMKEATEMREAEKAKNAATIKDATEALDAVGAAKKVLEEFYKKASQATAFVQVSSKIATVVDEAQSELQAFVRDEPAGKSSSFLSRPTMGSEEWDALANPNFEGTVDKGHKKGMQTFGETYKGQQAEAGGVLAMLEVIASDFANLEADTRAAEMQAIKIYEDFMNDSKKSHAVKSKSIQMFTSDKQGAEAKLASDTKDIKASQDELLAADRYYEKLKPTCVDTGISYEERVKQREAELQSLKDALKILEGADFAA